MSLLLTLEQGPRSQVVRQTRLDEGELVIGRSADAGWQIDDPDMFVSRAHCKISGGRDGYYVTDTSSSGLFIDDSDSPLGAGRSTRLQSGMRLRMGDYVLHVEVQPSAGHTSIGQAPIANAAPVWSSPQSRTPASIGGDDFFSAKVEEEPRPPRPAELPDPFEQPVPGAYDRASNQRSSPAFDDPFSLDPVATPASDEGPAAGRSDPFGFGDMPSRNDLPEPAPKPSGFDDFSFGPPAAPASANSADPTGRVERPAGKPKAARPWEIPAEAAGPAAPSPRPVSKPSRPISAAPSDMALRAAFLRGMGVAEADFPGRDAIAEMEKFGREYRLMLDGLMQLLRKRAEEKGSARVAQTMVGASEVNPLKFLPTVEDVIVTIISERSPGFLSGEAAIGDAVKDLAQHHVRAWRGVQAALRRMIDRFDPAAIEEELKSNSAIGNLLAGGRNAKLWELYQKRHRDIAQSAESSFLGEIGADFRDAYEEE
ncbi:conserved hypothetical protein [Mesorhizobium sp. SOD10]|nr:conserved hypothetical protein [Mesorhizobium sp. SOD10]